MIRKREYSEIKSDVMGELKKAFRPEFLNRIDEIIVFHQLTNDNIKDISVKMLDQLKSRLAENKITLSSAMRQSQRLRQRALTPYTAQDLSDVLFSHLSKI